MSRALFSVGDKVILCSKKSPQYNGQTATVIEAISFDERESRANVDGFTLVGQSNQYSYHLDVQANPMEFNRLNQPYNKGLWYQSSLRKKYDSSYDSCEEFMKVLNKQPVTS